MLGASAVGSWIDRAPSRLPPLLLTVSSNHGAIVAAYLCWLIWPLMAGYEADDSTNKTPFSSLSKGFLFGFILLIDVIHDLSAIGNRLSVERDWVPVLVGPIMSDTTYGLTQINAVMRRIDLICKLVAPSLLPLIVANFDSRAAWIVLLMMVTVLMWALEIWCAHIIANDNPQLRLPKASSTDRATMEDLDVDESYYSIKPGPTTWPQKLYFIFYHDPRVRLKHYFSMAVWPASISISALQMDCPRLFCDFDHISPRSWGSRCRLSRLRGHLGVLWPCLELLLRPWRCSVSGGDRVVLHLKVGTTKTLRGESYGLWACGV